MTTSADFSPLVLTKTTSVGQPLHTLSAKSHPFSRGDRTTQPKLLLGDHLLTTNTSMTQSLVASTRLSGEANHQKLLCQAHVNLLGR